MYDQTLRQVLAVSASDSPTPGGGSVSAMVGCLGTAMAAMVGNLTIGKPKYVEVEAEAKEITAKAYYIINRLEKLTNEDIKAFNNLMDAYRMPKNTDEEKAARQEILQKRLKAATNQPMEIARTLLEAMVIIDQLSKIGNTMAISDAGVAAFVCEAALNAVLLSADINIPSVTDQEFVDSIMAEKADLVNKAKALKESAVAVVMERMK